VSQSVVLVPFPEVAEFVEPWMERTCPSSKPSRGIPAHVTLLYPAPGVVNDVGRVLDGVAAFDVTFEETARFDDILYLVPSPQASFVDMTQALVRRFPDWPPYAGKFDGILPHLTVAQADAATLDAAERDVVPHLPVRARARHAVMLTEVEPQRWELQATFAFA
jgi:hypothetical protein